ncbi:MAG TPA: RecX family transcriptional regulator [Candidatus Krumholzibacteria bacterium]|nr:RecX family transcriptional regulator [Candidatus Krumholzibacteria bacterium]
MPETIVERKPRPRDRVWIRLSGGRFFAVPEAAATQFVVGAVLSAEDIERLDRLDQYTRGHDKAMRLLSMRSRSRREIESALRNLGIADAVRRGIIESLEEAGLVDDARFAREFVSVRKDTRRVGPHRLRADMSKLGLHRAVVDKALASYGADEQEALARALVERSLRGGPVDEKALRRVVALLKRKGYDYSVVNRIAYELARKIPRASDAEATENIPDEW